MHYAHFDFLVEEISAEAAEQLFDFIIAEVERQGLFMGGGFAIETDADYAPCAEVQDEQASPE